VKPQIFRGNEALEDGFNLRLPSGTVLEWGNRDYDINLAISDKAWDAAGQLFFNPDSTDGFLGDNILVNLQWKPYLEVRARRYRFRTVNTGPARYIGLALVDERKVPVPFYMIANDGNLLAHAVYFPTGVLPPQGYLSFFVQCMCFSL
jgi:hypothetical protein